MDTGLGKLLEAGESVAQLAEELKVKEVDLAVAQKETAKVLEEVSKSSAAAEKVKASVQVVKDSAQELVDAIDKDKAIAEKKLAAAKPALDAAEAALNTIKSGDIATVKKLGKPPHLIMRILDCVLILFRSGMDAPIMSDAEITDKYGACVVPSWGQGLKQMGPSFLNELMEFNKDLINEEMCELMEPLVRMPDYNMDGAKRVAGAVAGLCAWSEAMHFFFFINKEVLPLKAGLAKAEIKLAKATVQLNEAQATLDEKQAELDIVQAKFDATMSKKKALEDDAETCQRKMTSASQLIEGLSGEKVRWTAQSKEFKLQIGRLVGDVLLACGFLSYAGPFNAEFRELLNKSWVKLLTGNSRREASRARYSAG
jgi:dynein heavy chain